MDPLLQQSEERLKLLRDRLARFQDLLKVQALVPEWYNNVRLHIECVERQIKLQEAMHMALLEGL